MRQCTMALSPPRHMATYSPADTTCYREKLRDQNALSQEIVDAITGATVGETVDDTELEEELEQMQQEQLDEAILKTGNVPVADAVHKMPSPANAERELPSHDIEPSPCADQRLQPCRAGGRQSRRTTKRRSSGSCKPRWPCEGASNHDSSSYQHSTSASSCGWFAHRGWGGIKWTLQYRAVLLLFWPLCFC